MTRFIAMFMNGGRVGSSSLLSANGIGRMLSAGEDSPYGMGWFIGSENVYHGGSTIDYQAKVNIFVERSVGTVMLYNASDSTAANLFGAGYRDVVESDVLSILFGHDEDVGRFGVPTSSAVLSASRPFHSHREWSRR